MEIINLGETDGLPPVDWVLDGRASGAPINPLRYRRAERSNLRRRTTWSLAYRPTKVTLQTFVSLTSKPIFW